LAAGVAGAALSGVPSISITIARREDILASTRAVGRAVLPRTQSGVALFFAGGIAHVVISLGWGIVLARALPRQRTISAAVVAGLGIAALDLGVIGRRLPTIRALEPFPQVLDHVAYGAVVGAVLSRRRSAQQADGRGGAGSRS
jgi:hypothetical protein